MAESSKTLYVLISRRNKAVLEQAISEQEEIERITLANSKDRVKLLNKMQTSIEKIEITMKSYPLEDLNPLRCGNEYWQTCRIY